MLCFSMRRSLMNDLPCMSIVTGKGDILTPAPPPRPPASGNFLTPQANNSRVPLAVTGDFRGKTKPRS